MLLAIDVGNTNVVLGVFNGEELVDSWRLATLGERTADELGILVRNLFLDRNIDRSQITGVIMASVVPPLTGTITTMVEQYLGLQVQLVEATTDIGMAVRYDNPKEVGADRLVNGVAAFERHGRAKNVPVIVVDFGTATTFDAISVEGEYLGGVICPGVQISSDALFQHAARLPRVEVRKPPQLIGRTTVSSIQSGLFYGYVALVEGIVQRLKSELGGEQVQTICIATGGMADVIANETDLIEHLEPDLALHGLQMVWERTRHD